jgi:hypothetical protein
MVRTAPGIILRRSAPIRIIHPSSLRDGCTSVMDASRWSQRAYPTHSVEVQQRCACALAGISQIKT